MRTVPGGELSESEILMAVATPPVRKDRHRRFDQVGTVVAKSGLSHDEFGSGYGPFNCTVFTLDAMAMTITDALAYASQQLYNFPTGLIRVYDAVGALTLTTTSAIASTLNSGVTVNWGLGTAAASAATLATTMINILPGTSGTLPAFTSSTVINVASAEDDDWLKHADAQDTTTLYDGLSTAVDLFLNIAVPTATDIDGDATVAVDGIISVYWALLHDGSLV